MKLKIIILSIILLLASCQNSSKDSSSNTFINEKSISINGNKISLELAITQEEQMVGLMNREKLDGNSGMLFVFEPSQKVSFWMKDTLIPLDMIYFDENFTILQIYQNVPSCSKKTISCEIYSSDSQNIKYVLEVNAGYTASKGIKKGDMAVLSK